MTPFQVYWFTRLDGLISLLDGLQMALVLLTVVLGFTAAGMYCYAVDNCDTEEFVKSNFFKKLVFYIKLCVVLAFTTAVTSRLIPTKQEAAVIYLLPKICNSEIAQELPGDLKSLYDMAKEYLKSLAPEKK